MLSISNGTSFFEVQLCIKISMFNEVCEFSMFLPDCHEATRFAVQWLHACSCAPNGNLAKIGNSQTSLKKRLNWASTKICSIWYTQYVWIFFGTSRKWLHLRPQQSTRSRPPKATSSAVFQSVVQSFPQSPKWNMHILSISNGTYCFRGPIMYWNIDFQEKTHFWETDLPMLGN